MGRRSQPFLGRDAKPHRLPAERAGVLILFAALWIFFCPRATAQPSVSLIWDPSPDTNVVGYALYYGNASGSYNSRLDVGTNLTGTVTGLTEGRTYYFVAVAYNAQGVESPPSNEVNFLPVAGSNQVWGRVLWGGRPVAGAQITATAASGIFQATTDTNGAYTLTGLGSTNTYTVTCAATGLTFTAQFSSPVSLAAGNLYGADFFANQPLPTGAQTNFTISGQVTDPLNGVAGVEVRGGGMVTTTDSSGNYQLTNFLNGTYTVAPRNGAWTFSPANRSVTINSSNSTGNNFSRSAPYSISGQVSGLPTGAQSPAPTVYLSNGRSVQATKAGAGGNKYWAYTLSNVPAGQYSLSAELSGYRIVPSGFTNPLAMSGSLTGMNFSGTAATVAPVTGRITQLGLPVVGVLVQANQGGSTIGSASSDSDGYYRIENLASGSYTILLSKTGYTFSPASQSVSAVPASGINFTASGPTAPPVISSLTASPSVVPGPAATTTLSVTASGAGALTYSWDALSAAGPVSYSANDSDGAASTTASFLAPGGYTFRARVTDSNGLPTTATVNVSVSAGPNSLAVSPYQVQVGGGQTVSFQAEAWDQFGNRVTVSPVWSVSGGGSINNTGLFSASAAGGPYTVTAVAGSLSATGAVWVTSTSTNPIPPTITTQPLSQFVAAGSNVTLSVVATGTTPLVYQWQLNGSNIAGATGTAYTRTNAQSADAGSYTVVVTNGAGRVTSSAAVLTVNNAPVLAAINNRTLHAGGAVIFTNTATDLDAPPQTLTFSLDPGFPAGATIGPTNGVFAWGTTAAQVNATNPVTVRVTDNGNPSLSDAKSFVISVIAPLSVSSISVSNGSVTITWTAVSGTTYRVQYKNDLNDSAWNTLPPDVTATGPTASKIDPLGAGQRFYRLQLLQ